MPCPGKDNCTHKVIGRSRPGTVTSRPAAWLTLFDAGEGRSQVTPAVNASRISKSESPWSTFALAILAGVLSVLR